MTQDKHDPVDDEAPANPPPTEEPTQTVPPQGAGFPPPGGFPPPPPGTGGFATRYGLVRPAQGGGRVVAGVAVALGRATNTDPVLWRVLFAVLTLAGGFGLFAYVVGWLLIPAEGDTGSPLEALFGRGRSSASPVLVVIVGIITALAASSFVYDGLRPALLVVALIAGAVILLGRNNANRSWQPPPPPPPVTTPPPADPTMGFPPVPEPTVAAPAYPAPPGYRAPFAPRGPYASSPYPYPGPGAPPAPPATPPRPPSRLGRFTLSLLLLVLGLVAIIDIVNHDSVPAAGYAAAALATVGVGLLVGAWFGRARGLIAWGLVLTVVLGISSAVGHVGPLRGSAGDVSWEPVGLVQLSDRYEHGFGNATLDLRQVPFDGQNRDVSVRLNAGNLNIYVPENVDVEVHARVNVGNADVFDNRWDGVNTPQHTVVNNGSDGPGGGHLRLDIQLNAGDLEVSR
jgi:phage shock protein PspC (stress-responsive transcriptional regulator)